MLEEQKKDSHLLSSADTFMRDQQQRGKDSERLIERGRKGDRDRVKKQITTKKL